MFQGHGKEGHNVFIIKGIVAVLPLPPVFDQPCPPEDPQLVGNGRRAHL